jgi:hypothetical protein
MPVRSDGQIFLVTGSTGSGKTTWALREAGGGDLLVWDSKLEWYKKARLSTLRTLDALHGVIMADLKNPAPFRYAYVGQHTRAHFEIFCRLAWVWLRAKKGRTLVVEELSDVTHPGKAPDAWGEILRKSRDQKARIFALTQRPAESDKTVAGNAAIIHAGFQTFPRDRKTMSEYLDVPLSQVLALKQFEWIERDTRARKLRTGHT